MGWDLAWSALALHGFPYLLPCCQERRLFQENKMRSLALYQWPCHQTTFLQWLAPSHADLECYFLSFNWHPLSRLPHFTGSCNVLVIWSLGKEAVRISQRSLVTIITHRTHPLLFRTWAHSGVSRHLCLEPHRATWSRADLQHA